MPNDDYDCIVVVALVVAVANSVARNWTLAVKLTITGQFDN